MILIHKKSHGILIGASCEGLGLNPAEWWEVGDKTSLGIKARRYYPCFDALTTKTGELLDVFRWSKRRTKLFDRGVRSHPRDWRHCHDKKSRLWRVKT